MISDLYNSRMSVTKISSEYGIAKSTIDGWIKNNKKIKVSDEEFMIMKKVAKLKKEIAKIKEENEILKKLCSYLQREIRKN